MNPTPAPPIEQSVSTVDDHFLEARPALSDRGEAAVILYVDAGLGPGREGQDLILDADAAVQLAHRLLTSALDASELADLPGREVPC